MTDVSCIVPAWRTVWFNGLSERGFNTPWASGHFHVREARLARHSDLIDRAATDQRVYDSVWVKFPVLLSIQKSTTT
jgi:hypothetical protein